MRRRRPFLEWPKRVLWASLVLALLAASPMVAFDLMGGGSVCRGTPADGALESAVRAPVLGDNLRPYCYLCVLALRTYGHEDAVGAMTDAYYELSGSAPGVRFVYGEIGWPWGGPFTPHRSHQNGLSIDFMVPLKDGRSLPTNAFNRFGYDEAFDDSGLGRAGRIDFESIALHLLALDNAARARGGGIARVVLAPDLQDDLMKTSNAAVLRQRITMNAKAAPVRHDDHYRVDFDFPCEPPRSR